MTNLPFDQRFGFDTELSLAASSFTGSAVLIGTLSNEPVIIIFRNQSNKSVFVSDNPGSTKGMTMVAGEEFVMDCRANQGRAVNGGFPIGTSFFANAASGTGSFKISIIYAK